jgi:hypothetical protein
MQIHLGFSLMSDAKKQSELCPELGHILTAELAAGNSISYTDLNIGDNALVVMLRKPFKTRMEKLPEGVKFSLVNDPHWWHSDYRCATHRHMLACAF